LEEYRQLVGKALDDLLFVEKLEFSPFGAYSLTPTVPINVWNAFRWAIARGYESISMEQASELSRKIHEIFFRGVAYFWKDKSDLNVPANLLHLMPKGKTCFMYDYLQNVYGEVSPKENVRCLNRGWISFLPTDHVHDQNGPRKVAHYFKSPKKRGF
jgi:hypothetical protein